MPTVQFILIFCSFYFSVDVNRAVHAVLTSCSEEEFVAQSASFAPLFYALGIDDSLSSRADLELAYISQICGEICR